MKIRPLSNRVTEWEVLPNAALHGKILELQNEGEDILDLTIGISNLPIPEEGKKAAIDAITNNNTPYTAIGGSSELKRVIQQKLKKQNNISCGLENIIVSTGAKQAIFQTLYVLTNPGDKVAVIRPYWPSYTQMMKMLHLEPFIINLNDIPELTTRSVDPTVKVLLFDLPHNPSGDVLTKKELDKLLAFAKKHNMYIIADESYENLIYEGERISLVTIDETMREQIITTFSVSQSFSMMGWRLGYAVANKKIIAAMEALQSAITAASPSVSQAAVTAIFKTQQDNYTRELITEFKHRRDIIYKQLIKPTWINATLPASGPYFWCNIEKLTKNSAHFANRLLEEEKIAVLPGEPFGTPGWIRIAFNVQPVTVLEDAVERIHRFGNAYENNKKNFS